MKNMSKRIQRMSERAAEIRQVAEMMPGKAAELRGAVATAAGQVRQLRTELTAGAGAATALARSASGAGFLRADAGMAATFQAVEMAAPVLKEAGYLLDGIDLEVVTGRVRARLWRDEEVKLEDLRVVLEVYARTPVEKALVKGLVQAAELAAGLELRELDLAEVVVDAVTGAALRIGWRASEEEVSVGAAERIVSPPPLPGVVTSEARPPAFPPGSFFSRPETTAAGASAAAPDVTIAAAAAGVSGVASPARQEPVKEVAAKAAVPPAGAQWRSSALDRFKKMPDLTKKGGAGA
jgi:hypothetical protein